MGLAGFNYSDVDEVFFFPFLGRRKRSFIEMFFWKEACVLAVSEVTSAW